MGFRLDSGFFMKVKLSEILGYCGLMIDVLLVLLLLHYGDYTCMIFRSVGAFDQIRFKNGISVTRSGLSPIFFITVTGLLLSQRV